LFLAPFVEIIGARDFENNPMKINVTNRNVESERTVKKQPSVVIAQNLVRESVMLDRFGNQIDMRTKQIINKAEKE
jgi:hypothetical protein